MTTFASKLAGIANELMQIAGEHGLVDRPAVAEFSERVDRVAPDVIRRTADFPNIEALIAVARREYQLRQARIGHIPEHLLGEPAWDILLDLYVNQLEPVGISVTSSCIASGVPATTALRWLGVLETEGWIERRGDENDRRRYYLTLTAHGRGKMTAILSARLKGDRKEASLFQW